MIYDLHERLLCIYLFLGANQIRVVHGDNSCSGRVEIYHNGEWGTVCDDYWDLSDAEVVCRQLGCGKAVGVPQDVYFGQGSGKIWLDDVRCSGTESSITQCKHNGFGVEDCDASEDAGVVCSGMAHTLFTVYTNIV